MGLWGQSSRLCQKIKEWGQVIYLPKMFRIDEKLEFKSANTTTMTNNK
jgi:hypothetical protein